MNKALVVGVVGVKGGVGCTFLAARLAQVYALAGKNTVLCDLNWRSGGDIHLFLDTPIQSSLEEWLKERHRGDKPNIEPYLELHESGLQVLAAPIGGTKWGYGADVAELVRQLTSFADVVVLDCGSNLNELTSAALDSTQVTLLVTTGDVLALHHLVTWRKRLQQLQYLWEQFHIVLNRFFPGEVPLGRIKELTGGDVFGLIPPEEPWMVLHEMADRLWQMVHDGKLLGGQPPSPSSLGRLWKKIRRPKRGRRAEELTGHRLDKQGLRQIKLEVHQQLMERIDVRKLDLTLDQDANLRRQVETHIADILSGYNELKTMRNLRLTLVKEIADEVLGLGHLEEFLQDPEITEIMVNGADRVYVERGGRIQLTDRTFINDAQVLQILERILAPLGRRIDESSPMVDARLPDGSRVNAVIPPLAVDYPTVTIRKFAVVPFTLEDLIDKGMLDRQTGQLLAKAVADRKNIVISGGTGSGKTTLLNVLSDFIGKDERIITIEDAAELRLKQNHVIRLEARPPNIEGKGEVTIRDLVRNALRMRPDRIIVGEVRGGEALDMLQAMNTGHKGSLSTIHANSPKDAIARLETMVLMANVDLPLRAIRSQIASAIDLIVHTGRMPDGSRRVLSVGRIAGIQEGEICIEEVGVTQTVGAQSNGEMGR